MPKPRMTKLQRGLIRATCKHLRNYCFRKAVAAPASLDRRKIADWHLGLLLGMDMMLKTNVTGAIWKSRDGQAYLHLPYLVCDKCDRPQMVGPITAV